MELLGSPGWPDEARDVIGPHLLDVLTEADARHRALPVITNAGKCTCDYDESEEMTRHAPLCALTSKAVTLSDVDQIVNVLTPEYLDLEVTPEIEKTIEKWGNKAMADVGVAPAFNMLNPLVTGYVDRFSSEKIVGINDTTRDGVRRVLVESIEAGEGADELARRMRDKFDQFSLTRSASIARTEVNTSANFATWGGHKMSGVVDKRGWSTALDGRARADHVDANGQVVGIDEPFTVGGHETMYPGGTGVAEQDIQCRCGQYAVIEDPKTGIKSIVMVKAFDDETRDDQDRVIVALQIVFDQQLQDVLAELRKVD